MKPGSIRWMEIPSADLDKSCAFYENVFGWKTSHCDTWPNYAFFDDPDEHAMGGFDVSLKPQGEDGFHLFIFVESVDDALAKIEANGGKIAKTRELIHEEVGWWGAFYDPAGNYFCLWERSKK